MDIQTLLDKIISDANDAAKESLKSSGDKAKEIRLKSEKNIEQKKAETLEKAKLDCVSLEERMFRMAELEDKKLALAQKRIILDEAFIKAEQAFKQIDKKILFNFFLSELLKNSSGGETLRLCTESKDTINNQFFDEANKKLAEKGAKEILKLDTQLADGFGFMLINKGSEIICTAKSLIEQERFGLEQEVAQILFD